MAQPREKHIVPPEIREGGHSWGLQYPIVFGCLDDLGWCCWDRASGLVTYVSTHENELLAMRDCERVSKPLDYDKSDNFSADSVA